MDYSVFNNIKIGGIAVAVPENVIDNRDAAKSLGVDDIEKFIDRVGVAYRHVATNGQTTSDLCYEAADHLFREKSIDRDTIDAILFVSQTPDYIQPATAYVLHGRLRLPKSAIAFDINLGCTGFVYGLSVASALINGMGLRKVLLLVGDIMRKNKKVDPKDELLFGDVGSATIVEYGDGVVESSLFADGAGYTSLIIPGGGTRRPYTDEENYWEITKPEMDGESVMSFTITKVPNAFKTLFANNKKCISDYDLCLLHQANKQMVDYIAKKIKVDFDRLPMSMREYGNTDGASSIVSLADWCEKNKTDKDDLSVIAAGYGIGLSWGVVTFHINPSNVLPIIKTSSVFKEGYHGKI